MLNTTPPTTKNLWCATCGTYRGTTSRPHYGRHLAPTIRRDGRALFDSDNTCTDTDTFTDD